MNVSHSPGRLAAGNTHEMHDFHTIPAGISLHFPTIYVMLKSGLMYPFIYHQRSDHLPCA